MKTGLVSWVQSQTTKSILEKTDNKDTVICSGFAITHASVELNSMNLIDYLFHYKLNNYLNRTCIFGAE